MLGIHVECISRRELLPRFPLRRPRVRPRNFFANSLRFQRHSPEIVPSSDRKINDFDHDLILANHTSYGDANTFYGTPTVISLSRRRTEYRLGRNR